MQCPGCASVLDERAMLGRRMRACDACGAMWIARPDVLALRQARASEDPLLSEALPAGATTAGRAVMRGCPACGARMLGFAFAGGNVRVEACDACDHAFLERGELVAIVAEAQHGIEMSEEARQALHTHRVQSTWARMSGTDLAILVVGVFSIFLFLRIVREVGPTAITVASAGAVALGVFLMWRRKLQADHQKDAARLGRLMAAEEYRLAEGAQGQSPVRRGSAAAPCEQAAPAKRRTRAKPQACPFCGAAMAAGSTHCKACDSDFGSAASQGTSGTGTDC